MSPIVCVLPANVCHILLLPSKKIQRSIKVMYKIFNSCLECQVELRIIILNARTDSKTTKATENIQKYVWAYLNNSITAHCVAKDAILIKKQQLRWPQLPQQPPNFSNNFFNVLKLKLLLMLKHNKIRIPLACKSICFKPKTLTIKLNISRASWTWVQSISLANEALADRGWLKII